MTAHDWSSVIAGHLALARVACDLLSTTDGDRQRCRRTLDGVQWWLHVHEGSVQAVPLDRVNPEARELVRVLLQAREALVDALRAAGAGEIIGELEAMVEDVTRGWTNG